MEHDGDDDVLVCAGQGLCRIALDVLFKRLIPKVLNAHPFRVGPVHLCALLAVVTPVLRVGGNRQQEQGQQREEGEEGPERWHAQMSSFGKYDREGQPLAGPSSSLPS